MKMKISKTVKVLGVYAPCKVGGRIGNSLHGDLNGISKR